jgi:hypothetical protein
VHVVTRDRYCEELPLVRSLACDNELELAIEAHAQWFVIESARSLEWRYALYAPTCELHEAKSARVRIDGCVSLVKRIGMALAPLRLVCCSLQPLHWCRYRLLGSSAVD